MTPVSSVTAFLARARCGDDPQAARVLAAVTSALDEDARAVVDAQREPPARRMQWLQARTGHPWTAAELAHVEARAFVAIRRQLQAQGVYAAG